VSLEPALSRSLQGWRGHAAVAIFFFVVAAAFSWPAARLDPSVLVTRHFDLYVTVWLVEQAPDVLPAMISTGSAWPGGESLAKVDSYLLLLLAWAGRGLLSSWLLVTLLTWFGPALNALAAEHCARHVLAVRRPWSLLAGLAYGFSGIAASAVLEGHVYFLLAAWLPLLLTVAWTGPDRGFPWRRGLLLGALWALSLLSSAYLGILASALLATAALARPRQVGRLLPSAALIAVPTAAWYLWVFSFSQQHATLEIKPDTILTMGTATLASLTTWTAETDLVGHSVGAPLGFVSLWLLLFAPLLLKGQRSWMALALLALLALLLCFGRDLRVSEAGPALASPVGLLVGLPGVDQFRFPVRFAWLFALCGGLVAAASLQSLARRLPAALLWPVLGLALVDALLGTGLPFRVQRAIAAIPSAYQAAPQAAPVLDLYGRSLDGSSGELEMWTRNLACYYQSEHRRPILELCMRSEVDSPRESLDATLSHSILSSTNEGTARELRAELERRGIGAVALHADFYEPLDLELMAAGLERSLGPASAESHDGGERVLLYEVAMGGLGR
jgi:hypothetical protein